MKVYITSQLHPTDAPGLHKLAGAVRAAHMKDFHFARDVEQYQPVFASAQDRWDRIYDELGACDALLLDVTRKPSGGNVIECGMAYAMRKPIIVAVKRGADYGGLIDGIAAVTVQYDSPKDITRHLQKFHQDRNFTAIDRGMLFALLVCVGAVPAWWLGQLFIPLAAVWAVGYWLIIRRLFAFVRLYDRLVIYIPLATVWAAGVMWLLSVSVLVAWAWALLYWLVVILVLQKMKIAL